jgi:hypothetical protein
MIPIYPRAGTGGHCAQRGSVVESAGPGAWRPGIKTEIDIGFGALPPEGEVGAAVEAGLGEGAAYVPLDAVRADADFGGDLSVGEPAGDAVEDAGLHL